MLSQTTDVATTDVPQLAPALTPESILVADERPSGKVGKLGYWKSNDRR